MYDRAHRDEALEEVAAPEFRDDLPDVLTGYGRVSALLGLRPDGTPTLRSEEPVRSMRTTSPRCTTALRASYRFRTAA